jgi:hypothetical protein
MTHEQLVEKVARIVCCGGDDKCDRRWINQAPCDIRAEDETSMGQARAILALVAGELREPSAGMLGSIHDGLETARHRWQSALAASPLGGSLQPKDDV